MATNKTTNVLVPRNGNANKAKATLKAGTATVSNTPTIDTALCDRLRAAYSQTYYADPVNNTGDAVCTLGNDYIMKIVADVQAHNPTVPITPAVIVLGADNKWHPIASDILGAMANAQNADNGPQITPDISATNVRSTAAAAAMVMNGDSEIDTLLGNIIVAKETLDTGPVALAFRMEKDFVRYGEDGKLLCNMIEGTGPDFDNNKYYPWPVIGTKETDDKGNKVNNPDVYKTKVEGVKSGLGYVSWYYEAMRMTERGKALYEQAKLYDMAASVNNPSGKYADQKSPDYLDRESAEKKARQCRKAIQTMTNAFRKAVLTLRQMWAVNEMSKEGQTPRCVASFATAKTWDVAAGKYVIDASKLGETSAPIIIKDTVADESERFDVGSFLSMDTYTAGVNGGSLTDLRKAVGKAKIKRPGATGAGQGATPTSVANVKASPMEMQETADYMCRMATTFETTATLNNYRRWLLQADHDDDLVNFFHVFETSLRTLQTMPELRTRLVALVKTMTSEELDDMVGLGSKQTGIPGTNAKLAAAFRKTA